MTALRSREEGCPDNNPNEELYTLFTLRCGQLLDQGPNYLHQKLLLKHRPSHLIEATLLQAIFCSLVAKSDTCPRSKCDSEWECGQISAENPKKIYVGTFKTIQRVDHWLKPATIVKQCSFTLSATASIFGRCQA